MNRSIPAIVAGALLLVLAPRHGIAQAVPVAPPAEPRWQVTLDSSEYVWDVRLVKLERDTLIVRRQDSLIGAPVSHITELRLLPETTLLVGDSHESAITALAGGTPAFNLAPLSLAERESTIRTILARLAHTD
jgi:hypothetical protein